MFPFDQPLAPHQPSSRLSGESSRLRHLMAGSLLGLAALGCCVLYAEELVVVGPASAIEEEEGQLVREGVRLHDEIGEFKVRGDRAIFIANEGKQQFGGLENQNLERIVRKIADNPTDLTWEVTGIVTEYRGTNYLLVTHAVIKARTTTSSPVGGEEPSQTSP